MTKRPYPRYQRRHDAILLSILENPLQTNKEIAKATGYSPSQISRILCSPDFLQLYDAAFRQGRTRSSNQVARQPQDKCLRPHFSFLLFEFVTFSALR